MSGLELIRRRGVAAILVSLIVAAGLTTAATPAAATGTSEEQMWRSINAARAHYGRAPLKLSQSLSDVARSHSRKMRLKGTIFHSTLRRTVSSFSWSIAGENVGMGPSMSSLHRAFMKSPGHRSNILYRGFKRVGIGVAWRAGIAYITVIFLG